MTIYKSPKAKYKVNYRIMTISKITKPNLRSRTIILKIYNKKKKKEQNQAQVSCKFTKTQNQ